MKKPELIELPSYADDRGILCPVWNDWSQDDDSNGPTREQDPYKGIRDNGMICHTPAGADLDNVKRAYFIQNSQKGVVRGFHYHQKETKYFVVVQGMAKFVTVKAEIDVTKWEMQDDKLDLRSYVLSDRQQQMLIIPPGYANGWMSLTDDCLLMALSSSTFEMSKNDDIRFPSDAFGDVWEVKAR